jgi:hypothetical protein
MPRGAVPIQPKGTPFIRPVSRILYVDFFSNHESHQYRLATIAFNEVTAQIPMVGDIWNHDGKRFRVQSREFSFKESAWEPFTEVRMTVERLS